MKRLLLALLMLATVLLPVTGQQPFLMHKRAAFQPSGAPTTSYDPPLGSGDRTATQTMSATGGLTFAGSVQQFINGAVPQSGFYFAGTYANTGERIICDFGVGESVLVNELRFIQSSIQSHGTWQFKISDDLSTWTPVGVPFEWGTSADQIVTEMSANTTPCRAWCIEGTGGSASNIPYLYQILAKCAAVP